MHKPGCLPPALIKQSSIPSDSTDPLPRRLLACTTKNMEGDTSEKEKENITRANSTLGLYQIHARMIYILLNHVQVHAFGNPALQ